MLMGTIAATVLILMDLHGIDPGDLAKETFSDDTSQGGEWMQHNYHDGSNLFRERQLPSLTWGPWIVPKRHPDY